MALFPARDQLYASFLVSYVLVIVFFDSLPLYPPRIIPAHLLALQAWYKDYFNDQLLIAQPPWFRFFSFIELFYQLPVSVWGIWALRTRSPKAPAHLLVWAIICCGTTLTCLCEFYHHQSMSDAEKTALIAMYGGYAVIFGLIGTDMFCRIQRALVDVGNVQRKVE